jgi:hypothetical protein
MPLNTDPLVLEVSEAIENAADNGFPTDELTNRELAEDLNEKTSFEAPYSINLLEQAVQAARKEV